MASDDLVGRRFGLWSVLAMAGVSADRKRLWSCRCDCGTERDVSGKSLRLGVSTSCGCSKRRDMVGECFGAWTVISNQGLNANHQSIYRCQCDCGSPPRDVVAQALRDGKSKSCGCQKSSAISKALVKHGRAGSRAYQVWKDMIRRCTNPKSQRWDRYGGRGIKVCKEWMVFENWNADMGDPPPNMSLDRIDNNGNYERSNCKWSTQAEQNANREITRDLFDGRYEGRESKLWAPEYRAWKSMKARCRPGDRRMRVLYADRGITVCERWMASFDAFLADMGPIPRPGLTLDRIDNDKGYEPGNCRWADNQVQAQNRRQNQRNKAA